MSVLLAISLAPTAGLAKAAPTAADRPQSWLNWVLPMPKEARIQQQITLPAEEVKLTLRADAGALEQNALHKLQGLFRDKAGVTGGSRATQFEILLGVCDAQGRVEGVTVPDAARLKTLPNREQAYLIRPVGADRLVLTAPDGRGVFYAALTLRQLLEARFQGDRVSIPLAVITDWPDLAERGMWGGSATRDIEWMAERKMNVVEFHSPHFVDAAGKAVATADPALMRRGKMNGVNMVPIILHFNYMGHRGVYAAYPDLKGKGKSAVLDTDEGLLETPCASNPKLKEILADWLRGFAGDGATDVCIWLSELEKQRCECPQCAQASHHVLETRACIEAWRLVRKQFPNFRIRVLLTQGSYDNNDQVLAEVPPGVDVTYYDGSRTYDVSTNEMIYPLMKNYAQTRWLGVYPTFFPHWRYISPWTCPQLVRFRMTEFADKKLANMTGFVAPDNRLFDFNVAAAAEWGWNAHGRTEQQFAVAWATRQGFDHPESVADWAVKLGAVSWDLYGPNLVARYLVHPVQIKSWISKRTKPVFGQGMFSMIPDEARLRANRAVCAEVLPLAEQVGSSAMVAETQVIATYYDMLIEICNICNSLSAGGVVDRSAIQQGMNRLALAAAMNCDAYRDWERTVKAGAGESGLDASVRATIGTAQAVADRLKPWGVSNPCPLALPRAIGGWKTADFQEAGTIEKAFDVTDRIATPGRYTVTFKHTSSSFGSYPSRAALAVSPSGKPMERTELSVDEHNSSVPNPRNGKNAYHLQLDAVDPSARYFVVVRVRNPRPDLPAARCNGDILLEREREPDWQARIMNLAPLPQSPGK
jgi:hypothetical protein